MSAILFLVLLCSKFLLIKTEGNGNITVKVVPGDNCTLLEHYTFTEGDKVSLVTVSDKHINHSWLNLLTSSGTKTLSVNFTDGKTARMEKSVEGIWEFKYFYLIDNRNFNPNSMVYYMGHNYTMSICKTNIAIVRAKIPTVNKETNKYHIIIGSVVGIALLIISAQTAYIINLKIKTKKINRHKNLSKKMDSPANDTARYCSNPGQKIMKVPPIPEKKDRDSVIYEAPNIELLDRLSAHPPEPPAITTMPRTPRPDHNIRTGPQSLVATSLISPTRVPSDNHPGFTRPSQTERELAVSSRPPLPLPTVPQDNRFEIYEEMDSEDTTYEQPPIVHTMPPRLPGHPKSMPSTQPSSRKENLQKFNNASKKPPVTSKPLPAVKPTNTLDQMFKRRNNDTSLISNELEQALRRRNNDAKHLPRPTAKESNEFVESLKKRKNGGNVMHVPIVSIPEPGNNRGSSPKPKPPPTLRSNAKGPIHPGQEEIYYNENQESSDEEWTYEPLKPLNSYEPNIYNI